MMKGIAPPPTRPIFAATKFKNDRECLKHSRLIVEEEEVEVEVLQGVEDMEVEVAIGPILGTDEELPRGERLRQ